MTGAAPHPLAVWAPDAARVTAIVGAGEHPLVRGAGGWWAPRPGTLTALPHGTRYGYRLDDDQSPLPDPRSRWQPDGVHDLSAVFDHTGHPWHDAAWTGRPLAGGVLYELHIGTFTEQGTFDAAAERLPHLVALGVTHVEVLPVNAFNGAHGWGYDGVLWSAVQESYGGPAGYLRFVDACHAAGLAVIQDVVYNHLGPSGNVLPRFGPYLHDARRTTWGSAPNLDGPGSDEVRRLILDNARMWLEEYHADGLRLDAVHALVDDTAVHLLEEIAVQTQALSAQLGRPLTVVAESDLNDPVIIRSREAGGYGLDAQWADDFHHAVHVALTGETDGYYGDFAGLASLEKVLTHGFFHDGTFSSFRDRRHGRPIDRLTTPASRLVVCTQNHDQIGNRAAGDRLSATLSPARLGIAAVLLLTAPYTPMLFMGEEWGASTPWQFFTSHPEPELGAATARGRAEEFARMGWDPAVVPDPQDPATFIRSTLDWSEPVSPDHAPLLELYRTLIALRRRLPELTAPDFSSIRVTTHDTAIEIERGRVLVTVNLGSTRIRSRTAGVLEVAVGGATLRRGVLDLPPDSAAVVLR